MTLGRTLVSGLLFALAAPVPWAAAEDALPVYLQDRGEGVTTSLFGTYVRGGELLVYPFYEFYSFSDEPYSGEDLEISDDEEEYSGRLRAHEAILFFAYGITDDLAIELESKLYEKASLKRASNDMTSGLTDKFSESQSFGALQAQLRWRVLRETENRPEVYTWVEIDHPLKKEKVLVGSADWEGAIGIGFVKGFRWGTITPRASLGYSKEDDKWGAGEWAVEYLKRVSDHWRLVATVEGEADKEISLIGEVQYSIAPRAVLKLNSGFGVHGPAPDFAPEVGIIFSF